ncbi:MAG: DUF1788 domain-containing protein [Firmicutes bacterium]|nr:DUF1788 domain-containing protein [Bacillota bacterium]
MSQTISERLNQVVDKLLSKELLSNSGLGNEIGFYIFDYSPSDELVVRAFIGTITSQIKKRNAALRFTHLNLFETIVQYLKDRKILDKAYDLQKNKGDGELQKALKGPLHEEKIAKYLVTLAPPEENDLVILSGVGSAYPLLRSHTLLNSLHPLMNSTPLVMFYPGHFDGQGLRLFGKLKENNYYRAFPLVP